MVNLACLLYAVLEAMHVQAHVFDFLSSHAVMIEYEHCLNETCLKDTEREGSRTRKLYFTRIVV